MLSMLPFVATMSGVLTSLFFYRREVLFSFTITEAFEVKILFYILLGVGTAFTSLYLQCHAFSRFFQAVAEIQ
jgi:H+/Cl- antiporter ClcA